MGGNTFRCKQGPILRPILFNIFQSELLLLVKNVDFASYGDDSTGDNIDDTIVCLQESSKQGSFISELSESFLV